MRATTASPLEQRPKPSRQLEALTRPDERTIWQRRAEVGLEAPDSALRSAVWSRLRLLTIAGGDAGYDPWPSFAKAHDSGAMFVLCSGSERVGKSIATAMEGMAWVPVSQLIWIGGPQYRDTLKEFWYMAEACLNAGITTSNRIRASDKGPSRMEIIDPTTEEEETVCLVETRSLYNIERSVISEAPDIILVVEAGGVQHNPLEKLRLRVSTRRGRVWLSGTLEEGSAWFDAAYDRWQERPNKESGFSISVPLYENTQDFPGGAANAEIQAMRETMRPSTFSQRVEGRPAPSDLLVFNETFRMGRRPFNADPYRRFIALRNGERVPVEISVDPGWNPSYYAVHFIQKQEGAICVVDEVVARKTSHEVVIAECRKRPAWDNVVGGVMDPWAAKQHGMGNSRTALEIWYEETGLKLDMDEAAAPTPNQIIDRYWYYLTNPISGECSFFFNPITCPHFDIEWGKWKYHLDVEGKPKKDEPSKRNCDGLKGVGCWLVREHARTRNNRLGRSRPTSVRRYTFA